MAPAAAAASPTGAAAASVSSDDATVPDAGARAAPRIRRSRPSLPPATPDALDLAIVDPDHYVIIKELARGGMGRVLLARDRRLGREVAVKEVIADSRTIARRFEREARITARLQHPSIVAVHEAGKWPSGEPFYVMPVVSGKSLDEAIAGSSEPRARIALVPHVLAIADAMAYAHGRRIIHRDLKPRNVLVGEYGETVVLDWGLAKDLDSVEPSDGGAQPTPGVGTPAGPGDTGDTTVGEIIGTPAYMPPEQATGMPVDARADVYAIGAILYHVLSGRPPFVAATSIELLAAVSESTPQPLRELAPDAASELVAIVERAMARDAAARYATARELADDLRRFQTGQLVGAHRYSLGQLARRWLRRHRTAVAATVAAAAAAATIGVVAIRRVVAAEEVATDERAIAVARQQDAEGLMQFMLVDLQGKLQQVGKLDLLDTVARRAAAYYDAHDNVAGHDAYLAAIARLGVGKVLESRGDLRGALEQDVEAWSMLETVSAQHPEERVYASDALDAGERVADIELTQGETPAALDLYRALLARAEAALAATPRDEVMLHRAGSLHARVASAVEQQGDLDGALVEYRKELALAAARADVVGDTASAAKDLLNAHGHVGKILFRQSKDLEAALAEYRIALELGEKLGAREPHDPRWMQDIAIGHDDVGSVLAAKGDHAGALVDYRAGVAQITAAVAIDPTNTEMQQSLATLDEKVGIELFAQKDLAGAAVEYAACDAIWQQLVARDPTNLDWARGKAVIENKLGDIELGQKHLAAALAIYRSSLELRERLLAKDPTNAGWRRDVFYSHFKLAVAYDQQDDHAHAVAELRTAATIADDNFAMHPTNRSAAWDAASIRTSLGDELVIAKDPAAARAAYDDGLAIVKRAQQAAPADADWAKLATKIDGRLATLK
nr:serine/threonine-protein kinase [Kofleriaceae bacterium]